MRHPPLLALIVLFVSCLTLQTALGQQGEREPLLIDIDFPGGTFADYVEVFRKAAGNRPNIIIVHDVVNRAPLPPIELRQVDRLTAAYVWNDMSFTIDGRSYRLMIQSVGTRGIYHDPGTHALRILAELLPPLEGYSPGIQRIVAMAAQPLLDAGVEREHLLSAIEIVLGLVAEHDRPAEVRFHEATGLVLAKGSGDQIGAVQQIMATLQGSVETRLTRPIEDLEAKLGEARALIESRAYEMREARKQIEAMREERASFTVHTRALEAEMQRIRETAEERLMMERERAEQQAEIARRQVQAQMEGELKKMLLEKQDLERRLASTQQQLETEAATHAEAAAARDDLNRRIEDMNRRWERQANEWRDEHNRLQARIRELETVQREGERVIAERNRLQARVKELEEALAAALAKAKDD